MKNEKDMKKILLGALLLLSIASYSQDDDESFLDKGNGHGNGNGHNDDDDNDDNNDDNKAPITDYLYILAIAGVVYAGKKLI